MDSPKDRPSGIPRLSRLPVPRSSIPKPVSSTCTTRSLRSKSSRDSFGGGELIPPKLRTAPSRDRLRSGVSGSTGRESPLRATSSRAKTGNQDSSTSKTPIVPGSQRRSDSAVTQPVEVSGADADLVDDGAFNQSPVHTTLPHDTTGIDALPDDSTAFQTPSRSRPSLSERTMETLAHVPSSPALSKKSSSFFDQGRTRSQGEGGNSRPGSSYNSDGSGRASSRHGSRPGSSASQDHPTTPNLRGSSMSFKTSLSTINSGTPRRTSSIGIVKTPQAKATPSRMSLTSATRPAASGIPPVPDVARSQGPDKRMVGRAPLKAGAKTIATRPAKPRTSTQGLFKKPSLPSMGGSTCSTDTTRTSEGAWDGSIPPPSSSTGPPAKQAASLTNRKSSAALRDQIAKARAAKRAAVRQASATQKLVEQNDAPTASNDEYGTSMEHDDPFNLRKGERPGAKVLQQRVAMARTTGRLNIAALGLKEIPQEVMKMYDLESVGNYGGNWAESVDLTRLVAADNEFEALDENLFPDTSPDTIDEEDDGQGNIFGGLETLDLHGNLLAMVPLGFRRLVNLTSLNLSSNTLDNGSLEVISQMTSLRDLKLSKNRLFGPLDAALMNLSALEMLDLHGNDISALPTEIEQMSRLRILNLNENKLEVLPFESLSKLPLTELSIRKNRLSGVLIRQPVESLLYLQTLDASANQLAHLVTPDSTISLPALHSISLSVNRLQCLPDMGTWVSLLTLAVDENHIASIPESFTTLQKLRHADFASNDIRTVPPEIARMHGLAMIRLTGNPLRDRKLISASTDELKEILAARLEPPPPYQEPSDQSTLAEFMRNSTEIDGKFKHTPRFSPSAPPDDGPRSDVEDDFTTPPTSAPHTPTRPRSQTVVKDVWFVKAGGVLDLSRSDMSNLSSQSCRTVASRNQVRQIQLHHNPLTSIPMELNAFASTLSLLCLANAQLSGESYITDNLEMPALRELSLMSNQITSLSPLTKFLNAPALEKIDVSLNRMTALPVDLKQSFPQLSVLLASSNQLAELDPGSIRGLKIVDASSNDIGQLNPRLGLLGGVDGLQRMEVAGNRFKVPRWSILERGTEATLRWLRGRLPAEEMAAWREANGEESGGDVD
ncbi:hypothetical protein QQS21_004411 [Conoideocrella luteorostrata]|uniref:Leucine-rich repeat-containing protein 40 n=1 Tax=Conoideocrella luteorostrata TaxID=1105319 RepID=A0AAJ0CTS9_9HYPO|nr:hypothetical protein QQS21_004411 [Conoideocrella luteorostrata]